MGKKCSEAHQSTLQLRTVASATKEGDTIQESIKTLVFAAVQKLTATLYYLHWQLNDRAAMKN